MKALIAFWNRLKPWARIAVVAVIVLILAVGSCRVIRGSVNSRIAKVEAQLAVAQDQAKTADANYKLAIGRLNVIQAQAKADTDAANKKLAALMQANAVISNTLAAEKAKTAALTSDALASSLGEYIGVNNVYASAAIPPTFVLTRTGAENSRNIFLESTALAGKFENCDLSREQDAVKIQAVTNQLVQTTNALDACGKARLSDKEVIDLLKKEVGLQKSRAFWNIVKASIPAAIVGGVIVFLVKK